MRRIRLALITLNILVSLLTANTVNSTIPVHTDIVFNKVYFQGNRDFGIVETIRQDSFGFIWIGAKDGLFRYDGLDYQSYNFDRSDTTSLSNNIVRKIFIDSRNRMWVSTEFGLNLYDPEKDSFTRFFSKKGEANSIPSNFITQITEDKQGNLWMSSSTGGLCMRETNTGNNIIYSKNSPLTRKISSNYLNTVYISNNGTIWIGTGDNGVQYFKPGEPVYSLKPGDADGSHIYGSNVQCIIESPDGNIWFGTNGNGISVFNPSTKKFNYFNLNNKSGFPGSNIISDFYLDSDKNIWICTDGGGLIYFNTTHHSFIQYKKDPKDNNSISSDIVRTIFEDKTGNFWVANYKAPINIINGSRKKFYTIRNTVDCRNCINGNAVNSVYIDSKNLIWFAIDGGGINVFDPNSNSYRAFLNDPNNNSSIGNNKPLSIEEDSKGNLWIGLFEGGVSNFDRATGTFKNYFPDGTNKNPRGSQIWDILSDDNNIWMASEKGIDVFNLTNHTFKYIPVDPEGKKGTNTYGTWKIVKDSKGRILIGTLSGLNVYNPDNNTFKYFEPDLTNPESISDNYVIYIYEDSKQRIWIGTNGGGLNLWLQPDNKFKCFTSKDGLSGDIISSIAEDNSGNLWISTNQGITKFNFDSLKFEIYNENDGLQGDQFNPNSCFKDKDGVIYFGGTNGLSFFNPDEITNNSFIPPVVLTGFSLFNSKVNIKDPKSPLTKNILFQKEIRLSHKQSVFTINFSSLNFIQPEENFYRYKLENLDEDWRISSNKNSATYTHLKPGKYTFKVIGSNNDKIWNTKGTSIDIIILPPFYKTKLFIFLEIFSAILLLGLIYNYRNKSIRSANFNLSKVVQERTSKLESQKMEIEAQNKEIIQQRDYATTQRDQIIMQNEELEKHRNNLTDLVEIRTKELLEAKLKAEDNNNLKTVFLEIINHEVRTPMNAILGFINLLSDKIDDPNSRSYYLKILKESGKNLLRLIEDITDFSRFHTGELKSECIPCNLNEMIRQLIGIYREKTSREKPEVNILMEIPDQIVIINSDAKKILQILNHLVDNSFKYTEKGFIKIGIKEFNDDFVTLFVEDSGISLQTKNMIDFFDRFYHTNHNNPDMLQRDSGLGLALAKHLTELLGGKIWIDNLNGTGMAFNFSLSCNLQVDNKFHINLINQSATYVWPGKKIIVAEDDETNFLLIEAIFKDSGVELLHAEDGVEFLEIIEKNPKVDLVLLDIRMPRLNGLNAIKIVRETMKDVPVIAQTAYDHGYHRDKAFESGCNHFLTKPLRKEELLNLVKTYLG